jgi:hypothetical protein
MQLDDILILLVIAGSIITSVVRTLNEQNKKRPPQNQQRPETGLPKQNVPTTQPGQPTQGDLQKRLEEARRRVQQAMENQTGRSAEGDIGRPPSTPPPLISGGLEGGTLEGGTLTGQTRERGTLEGQVGERGTLTGQTRERGTLEGQTRRRGSLESSGGLLGQPSEPKQPDYTFSKGDRDVFRPIDAANRNPSDFQQQIESRQAYISDVTHRGQTQLQEAVTQPRKRQRVPTGAPKHAKIGGSELLSPEMLTEKELLRGFLWQQILSEPRSKTKLRTYTMQKAKPALKK